MFSFCEIIIDSLWTYLFFTVECIDECDQNLAEYKPQIGDQPNPFENDTPTEIDDRPVEDYVGEGEDRPGGGIQF